MKPKILILASQKSINYKKAVEACGGEATVKYLPDADINFDGLLLCGGNDIFPSYYGQEINGAHDFDKIRDDTEFRVTKAFLATGKPILGICRGLQLLNVALGGTLIQDLSNANDHCGHRGIDSVHPVTAVGILERLYGNNFSVNSSHHQAIDKLGSGLFATAFSNGVIEAIEHKEKPYFAVQFHPERMCLDFKSDSFVDGIEIFKYFIELCKNKSV